MSNTPFKSCYGKQSYNTELGALKNIEQRKMLGTLRAYECPHCHRWHIGHPRHFVADSQHREAYNRERMAQLLGVSA